MDTVFKFLFQFLGQFFGSIWNGFVTMLGAFNIPEYISIITRYTNTLGGLAWVVAIIAIVLLAALIGFIVFLIVVSLKKFVRNKRARKDADSLVKEVQALNREVMRLNLEKDKILSMKVSQIGLNPNEIAELTGEEIETLNKGEAEGDEDTGGIRFLKLCKLDEIWADYQPPEYDNDITLPEFCDRFRLFACSRLGLYYDISMIRRFVAAFASTRLIVLQGISGTGKTSLAYAFGKFVSNPSVITPVQSSWRDRSELFGYFNEFTKKYNETELLRAMYEANFNENVYLVILDEMNIARVEYYFAEMLSILEMPRRDEWIVDLVPSQWKNDPKQLVNGKFTVPPNMWYCGTINNDDSTFAVTDKVYDRAMPINIDNKDVAFEAPDTPPVVINYHHFEAILNRAKAEHPVSEDLLTKLALVDDYIISHFRVAFGNRIMKQINPNYKAGLDLFTYLGAYSKPGYEIIGRDFSGKMDKEVQEAVYISQGFQHFMISIATNPALKRLLEERYQEERTGHGKAGDSELDEMIENVRKEEMKIRLQEIREREKIIRDQKSQIAALKREIEKRDRTIESLKYTMKVWIEGTDHEARRAMDGGEFKLVMQFR